MDWVPSSPACARAQVLLLLHVLLGVGLTTVDGVVESRPFLAGSSFLWAMIDTGTHGAVAAIVWLCVEIGVQSSSKHSNALTLLHTAIIKYIKPMMVTGTCAVIIDFDHFIKAKSFMLEDAVRIDGRPFLHSSLLALGIVLMMCLFGNRNKYSMLALAVFMTHHLRDAHRRGLFIIDSVYPIAVSYSMYIGVTLATPCIIITIITIIPLLSTSATASSSASTSASSSASTSLPSSSNCKSPSSTSSTPSASSTLSSSSPSLSSSSLLLSSSRTSPSASPS